MKRSHGVLIVVLLLGLLALMQNHSQEAFSKDSANETFNQTRFMMDTTVAIRAIGPDANSAGQKAFTEIGRVEQLFSRFEPSSEISKINAGAGEWVSVDPEVFALVKRGLEFGNLTDGRFDVTIGPLVTLWGFGTDARVVPSQGELEKTLEFVDFSAVELDAIRSSVRIPEGFVLDLGGIAKGYAVDAAAAVLRNEGVERGLINAGGDISVIGARDSDGVPWRVGIQDPFDPDQVMAVVELIDSTVVTSGDYQRYFEVEGVRFHHIIDPLSGFPADELTSVTVVASSAAAGDAWSTALFVLGFEKAQDLVENHVDLEAVIVEADGSVWISSGLENAFRFLQ